MRAVFFGSPAAAIPSLAALLDSEIDVPLVVTQPGGGHRRGRQGRPCAVASFATEHGVEVRSPERINELSEELARLGCDVGVVVAYGQIIPRRIIDLFPLGIFNLHFSLLPRWRGAAPVQRAILAGDEVTGVSVMKIDEGLDSGPVYASIETSIDPDQSAAELTSLLATLGAPLLLATLRGATDGSVQPVEQPADGVTVAPKLEKEECEIDWSKPAEEIVRLVRAAGPKPGAWSMLRGRPIKILRARIGNRSSEEVSDCDGTPGFLHASRSGLSVQAGDGFIDLLEVQPSGGRAMTGAEFAAGARLGPLDRLGGAPAT
ncbi:MAG: methionyl-tRNA formyltransferase [Acidobacteria bacterium]|nr:MAG: methionyl-tRNA formyltransferase [Acidobacteriota bacterium]